MIISNPTPCGWVVISPGWYRAPVWVSWAIQQIPISYKQGWKEIFKVTCWYLPFSAWLVSQLNSKGSVKGLKVKEIPVWSWNARYWRKKSSSEGHRRRFQKDPVCIGFEGFPGSATGKESTCQRRLDIRDMVSIPESERFLGGGYSNSLQYSCLENPMDRGAWWTIVYRVTKELDMA